MFLVFVITGIIAGIVIITAVTICPPAQGVDIAMEAAGDMEAVKLSDAIVNAITVNDFSAILSRKNMLPLIVFSILFGFCVSACGGEESYVGKLLNNLSNVMMKVIDIIMKYAPIGLCAYFANLVGEFGPNLLGAYGLSLIHIYSVLASIGHGGLKEGQVINKMLEEREKKLKREITDTEVLDGIAAVSYTHLDVYKRQQHV